VVEQPPNCDPLRLSSWPEDLFFPKEDERPSREGDWRKAVYASARLPLCLSRQRGIGAYISFDHLRVYCIRYEGTAWAGDRISYLRIVPGRTCNAYNRDSISQAIPDHFMDLAECSERASVFHKIPYSNWACLRCLLDSQCLLLFIMKYDTHVA